MPWRRRRPGEGYPWLLVPVPLMVVVGRRVRDDREQGENR